MNLINCIDSKSRKSKVDLIELYKCIEQVHITKSKNVEVEKYLKYIKIA